MPSLKPLPTFRLPSAPTTPLYLDGQPLRILDTNDTTPTPTSLSTSTDLNGNDKDNENDNALTPATAIATVLYNWHPNALAAFLDFDTWVSVTWQYEFESPSDSESQKSQHEDDDEKRERKNKRKRKKNIVEIGRIRNQISFGRLDETGEKWTVMFVYDIEPPPSPPSVSSPSLSPTTTTNNDNINNHNNQSETNNKPHTIFKNGGGKWYPNPRESILHPQTPPPQLTTQALTFLTTTLLHPNTAHKTPLHKLSVEHAFTSSPTSTSPLGIDAGDGIPISPHWLYTRINLDACHGFCAQNTTHAHDATTKEPEKEKKKKDKKHLNRCGKCGTAAYCSPACQRSDWKVHKFVCRMGLEERGAMLRVAEGEGGLWGWVLRAREEGEGEGGEEGEVGGG